MPLLALEVAPARIDGLGRDDIARLDPQEHRMPCVERAVVGLGDDLMRVGGPGATGADEKQTHGKGDVPHDRSPPGARVYLIDKCEQPSLGWPHAAPSRAPRYVRPPRPDCA